MYVCSLYTNIPNNEGIKAIETTLKLKNLQTKVTINFLKLILTLNNFIFNCTNFLQIKDVQWEQNAPQLMQTSSWVYLRKHIYPLIIQKVQLYLRYIDGIFFIWTGCENELQQFI